MAIKRLLLLSTFLFSLTTQTAASQAGEILWVAFTFVPVGYVGCDGQLLSIATCPELYNVIGTTYGGDGITTFAVPDLRGRSPIHKGQGPGLTARSLGDSGGVEQVALTLSEMPSHTHTAAAHAAPGTTNEPTVATFAASIASYQPAVASQNFHECTVRDAGEGTAHENMPPFVTLQCIIAVTSANK